MESRVIRLIVCFVLVGSYFFLPKYGFTSSFLPVESHFLYPFSHANIWHLAANIVCLLMLRCPLNIAATYSIAVLCSFLPSFSIYDFIVQGSTGLTEPTYGFSGILFAMVGISWGRINRFNDMLWKNRWFLIIPAFLPHVNFLIHIYCLLAGYMYGSLCAKRYVTS